MCSNLFDKYDVVCNMANAYVFYSTGIGELP